jgi:hypothetical protein
MLKSIVEHHHCCAELPHRQPPRKVSIRAHENRDSWKGARQHLRLITRAFRWLEHTFAVAHDDNAVGWSTAGVASA